MYCVTGCGLRVAGCGFKKSYTYIGLGFLDWMEIPNIHYFQLSKSLLCYSFYQPATRNPQPSPKGLFIVNIVNIYFSYSKKAYNFYVIFYIL